MISVKEAAEHANSTWTERDQTAFNNAERRIDEAITTMTAQVDGELVLVRVNLSGVASFNKKVRDRVEAAYSAGGWSATWSGVGAKETPLLLDLWPAIQEARSGA